MVSSISEITKQLEKLEYNVRNISILFDQDMELP